MTYTHLHVHTDYSLFDGTAKINDLFERADRLHVSGLAITDHGTMAGVPEFLDRARKYPAIKPIVGCECNITDHYEHTEPRRGWFHVILLAKNLTGYHNLVRLCSIAGTEGMYCGKPRISHRILEEYREGLVCTSACLGGEIPRAILEDDMQKAREAALWYKRVFEDDFYLEVWNHRADSKVVISESDNEEAFALANKELASAQRKAVRGLFALGKELGVKVIATNDVHFVHRADAIAQDALWCISVGKKVGDAERLRCSHMEFLRSESEMRRVFRSHPEVIDNTREILDKVERYSIAERPMLPPVAADPAAELRSQVLLGAAGRYGEPGPAVLDRIEYELSVIGRNKCENYFLIWKELADWARSEGIAVGPGRGSAAGSIVNYCLGITGIDPLSHGLLFERFMNPDRERLPDIDVDFESGSRERLVEHLMEKYGRDSVSYYSVYESIYDGDEILKKSAKVFGVDKRTVEKVVRLYISERCYRMRMSLKYLRENCAYVAARCSGNKKFNAAYRAAELLEGTHFGKIVRVYACLIGVGPLSGHIPLTKVFDGRAGKEVPVSQYRSCYAEDCGVLKLDLLERSVLNVIRDAVRLAEERHGEKVDIDRIPIDDAGTMAIFAGGDTGDVFQFEPAGMRESLRELNPDRFSDLVAMYALYRPGPLDYVPSLIARKNGTAPVGYALPGMEETLGETYGQIVYQEQIMDICKRYGGFSPGEADRARKAFGKCQREVLDFLHGEFVRRGEKTGYAPDILERIWKDMEDFGLYAFMKCHALCYTWIAWQCAWLKAHYPEEYAEACRKNSPD